MATVTAESLKKKRVPIRLRFKTCCSNLESVFSRKEDEDKIPALIDLLDDTASALFQLDEEIYDTLCREDATEQELLDEYKGTEEYKIEFFNFKQKYTQCINSQESESKSERKEKRKFNLPKLELQKFDGNVKNWLGFWGQFKKIDSDEEIEDEDKFQYLLQAMKPGTLARELVESFPPSGKNYYKALEQLKGRFARDEFLIETYVRELLGLVLQQATGKSGMCLSRLYDKLESQLRALESLGVTSEKYAAMLFPLVESSLPEDILLAWERHRSNFNIKQGGSSSSNNSSNINFLSMLLEFLRKEVESSERIRLAKGNFGITGALENNVSRIDLNLKDRVNRDENELYTAAALYSTESDKKHKSKKYEFYCIFCDGKTHMSQDCRKAQKLTLKERKAKILSKKACFCCFRLNHVSQNCRAFVKCIVCTKKHHAILCPELAKRKQKESEEYVRKNENVENALTNSLSRGTLLQTLVVRVMNGKKEKLIRAILDSGSQRSYILSKCAEELGYIRVAQENIIQGVFGGKESNPKVCSVYNITVQSRDKRSEMRFSVLNQEKICNSLPRLQDVALINDLKTRNIILSDTNVSNVPDEIELLLGADVFGKLLTGKVEHLKNGLVLVETCLGWTIMGQPQPLYESKTLLNTVFAGFSFSLIPDLWKLDILGIKDPIEVKKQDELDEETIRHFNETIITNDNGRYEVPLPWTEDRGCLLENKELAEARLKATSRKLFSQGKMEDYGKVFQEWESSGFIEKVPDAEKGNTSSHYLCHHAVIKEASKTTKIRPVFDASAKDANSNCLNNCLNKGPNLIDLIPPLLIKFRLGTIGVTADIEKAFLQISVAPKDRDYLRFLWWKDSTQDCVEYWRHCRVVFGLKPSPFLLAATINFHLNVAPENLINTANILKESFYVDNCITSLNSQDSLHNFIKEAKELMSMGKFNLRDWVFTNKNLDDKDLNAYTSVLGLTWEYQKDIISCDLQTIEQLNSNNTPCTKRALLSVAQKIFDPIGFTLPVTLLPKLLLQRTWELKISWDESLPENITKEFKEWLSQIDLLKMCFIPRSISFQEKFDFSSSTIHIFCDASKNAYAACIFIRIEVQNRVIVQLLLAKSRVAPKSTTIPRLELLACIIGIRLYRTVKKVKDLCALKSYFWSDSMVALTWIKSKGIWKTFVQNRVTEIQSVSHTDQWNYVPGDMNPADVISRGCSCKVLLENQWWMGPEWLKNEDDWPKTEVLCRAEDVNKESKVEILSNITTERDSFLSKFFYFSKYTKILRMTAWILRFYLNAKKPKNERILGELLYSEVLKAENFIIRLLQKETFKDKKTFPNLETFIDTFGLLRVKTKLVYAEDTFDFKYPMLLPHSNELVKILIREEHNRHNHAGVQILLATLREKYWILRARKMLKEVVRKCTKCRRFQSTSPETPFAPLPRDRIQTGPAFEVTGVDYAGPLYLKGGEKVWLVLFICAVYRAVHLELATSLSTSCFIMALRRFIARRGRIKILYSDNGTNFVGTYNLLRNIEWDEVLQYSSTQKINWVFNPPTACWWGGWWERLIRLIKDLLKRNIGKSTLNFEELSTIMCDIEATVNSRPLTYVEENGKFLPLTPNLFIQDLGTNETTDLDLVDRKTLNIRYNYLQKIREGLRSRFRKEYLSELVHRGKRLSKTLKVGDIVYVGSDNQKRSDWPLGKILETFKGKDGVERVARIKLQNGEIIRPFQRLFPLEIEDLSKEEKFETDKEIKSEVEEKKCEEEKEDAVQIDQKITRCGRIVKSPKRYGFDKKGGGC